VFVLEFQHTRLVSCLWGSSLKSLPGSLNYGRTLRAQFLDSVTESQSFADGSPEFQFLITDDIPKIHVME
jgi:hypothetical protein